MPVSFPRSLPRQMALAALLAAPLLAAPLLVVLASSTLPASADKTPPIQSVDFARDVQPLLKARCYPCHSQSDVRGKLRLDSRDFLVKGGVSGPGIVPGKSHKSLLIARVLGNDGKPRMPLGFAPLSPEETRLLQAWVDAGAPWPAQTPAPSHWAYIKPRRPATPKVKQADWVRNPIDRFVLARLEREKLPPSPQADRVTLLRRVTLDLTGLPPTPQAVDAFLADRSPDAYEKVVDGLLASPHYGERMALPWLDAARYADSNGFQQDGDTFQYVWRDWVVRALNANMPFDRFTIEQIAGDLLPNATRDQKVATGFNRNHLLNGEGGAIAEEQRNVILFDRVDVTATTWLGATMACAQCHDHKYDPTTQKDYYKFFAFFNNVPETGTPSGSGQYRIADPWVYAPDAEDTQKLKAWEAQIAQATSAVDRVEQSRETQEAQTVWEASARATIAETPTLSAWSIVGPFGAPGFDAAYDTAFGPEQDGDLGKTYHGTLRWTTPPDLKDGVAYPLTTENAAVYFARTIDAKVATALPISLGSDDAIKVWLNDVPVLANKVQRGVAPDQEKVMLGLRPGTNRLLIKIVNGGAAGGFYFRALHSRIPADLRALLALPASERSEANRQSIRTYFLAEAPPSLLREARERVVTLQKQHDSFQQILPRVMVMSDDKPRKTHLFIRGNYEAPGEEVQADTPAFLPPLPKDAPRNRLGLARWLVSRDNPLTARVQVNRYWQTFFGQGLVKTSEDFGTQGETPRHRALLDWLAVEFEESGWNVKRLHRLIVTSATYRQSSRVSSEVRNRDPENRLLSHASRFRLPSPILRDVALAASGLLSARIGGKPVYPYQPKTIWDGLSITKERDFTYPQSKGTDLYRRSLYTFWRRTVAPANMFDASPRQTCKVRLATTSTPLQALTVLNDITWVEAGRVLAQRVMKESASRDARLSQAFRRVCARRPTPEEMPILRRSLARAQATFTANPKAAEEFLSVGESSRDTGLNPVELAAYASVCHAIFNLDEALTRE